MVVTSSEYRAGQSPDAIRAIVSNKIISLFPNTSCNSHNMLITQRSGCPISTSAGKSGVKEKQKEAMAHVLFFPHVISLTGLLHITGEDQRSPSMGKGDCKVGDMVMDVRISSCL